ncbi:YhfC family glutamic-type intramembrane protease [Facklamia miroungae]|uniref:Uncharacterized membrane protein YhfC n=1 Tax=Facklamia miroungae TaxID=120956 RepID=A0A1G7PV61_9LACT|nr:YhfC family glutamic-type intramembrane protease [Facklamia miroungae]NKZ28841.1 YhfC family intramembrane metalloprotease [Facklamia miroungae]SDF90128.1 Uncharacterized membrane protein YhfC [Facklamia miroungae]
MLEISFVFCISIGLPLILLIYAFLKKRYVPFFLGVSAFVISQILIRIPLLQYFERHSISYSMFSALEPVLFAMIIGMSAGIFEEGARYLIIRFFMKQRDWLSGFLFGAGHGGIEAVLLNGIVALKIFFSPKINTYNVSFFIGGIERFFAMLLHIGLSIIILKAVEQKKNIYVLIAIFTHGFVDMLIGILPLFLSPNVAIISLETSLAIVALAVFGYSLNLKNKGEL